MSKCSCCGMVGTIMPRLWTRKLHVTTASTEHFFCAEICTISAQNPQCLHKSLHQNQTKKARKCDKAHVATKARNHHITEAFSRQKAPFFATKNQKNQQITASTFRESYISPEGQRGEQNMAEFACLQWPPSEGTVLSALSLLQMDTLSNGADVCSCL